VTPFLDIGPHLVAARMSRGMSQRALGELLGVKQQQVARWEASAYRTASLERVAAVAEALGIDSAPSAQPLLAAEKTATYGSATTPTVASVRDLGEVATRIREHAAELRGWGITRIGVFGSFATGGPAASSDVDLLVDYSEPPQGFAYFEAPALVEHVLGRKVDWVQSSLLKDRIKPRVLREVIYVWEA
jgi:uncharacterized protein